MPHILKLHTPNYTVVHRLHAPLHIVSESCSSVEIPGIRCRMQLSLFHRTLGNTCLVSHTQTHLGPTTLRCGTLVAQVPSHTRIATQAGAHPFHNNIRHAISFA